MATINKQKTLNAVKMIRDIRDKISAESRNMSFEELKAYISKKISENRTEVVKQASN